MAVSGFRWKGEGAAAPFLSGKIDKFSTGEGVGIACILQPAGQFESFCLVESVVNTAIKCCNAECGLEWPWECRAAIIFSDEI